MIHTKPIQATQAIGAPPTPTPDRAICIATVEVHPTVGAAKANLVVRGELANKKHTISIGAPKIDFATHTVRIQLSSVPPTAFRPAEPLGTFDRKIDLFSIGDKRGPWTIHLVEASDTVLHTVQLSSQPKLGW